MPVKATCGNCRYWVFDDETTRSIMGDGSRVDKLMRFGGCHRFPPSLVAQKRQVGDASMSVTTSAYPWTAEDDWCGECSPYGQADAVGE